MVAAAAAAIARTRMIMPASLVFATGFALPRAKGVLFFTFLSAAPSAVRSAIDYISFL
jgi:hypothetical protein